MQLRRMHRGRRTPRGEEVKSMRPRPPPPVTSALNIAERGGGACYIVAKVDLTSSSLECSKSKTKDGGTPLMMC